MGSGGVFYAEHELGVNRVHAETEAARARLQGIQKDLVSARDQKRRKEVTLADIELNILTVERGKHPSQSATWLKEHVKGQFSKSAAWLETRDEILKVTQHLDGLEMDRSLATRDIEIGVGRMHELAGYFQYLAALKMAETSKASA